MNCLRVCSMQDGDERLGIGQCTNLLVPVCISSSHIAYGSVRMEPVFMILGQSAAIAACIAIDKKQAVQEVTYENLKAKLLDRKQVLSLP